MAEAKPMSLTAPNAANTRYTPKPYAGAMPAATTTVRGSVLRQAAPAAAPVPFADLTAAANAYNALRTALINAGVLQ